MGRDLGYSFKLRVHVDSNTAKAITSRLGLGKVRHIEVRCLWAQEAHRSKRFEVHKVRGDSNPSDVLIKAMSAKDMIDKMAAVGARFVNVQSLWCDKRVNWADAFEDSEQTASEDGC